MTSVIYRGRVRHNRVRPRRHGFSYRVFYLYVDVEELDALDQRLRWFSHNRRNLFALYDRDHGADDGTELRTWADRILSEAGVELPRGTIRLLAYPRVLGYVFNPLSVWYCFDEREELRALIYEVRNTFGDKHSYVVELRHRGMRHAVDKRLHVSPFMDMEQTYHFAITEPGERLSLGIAVHDEEGAVFRAGLSGEQMALTDRALLRLFSTHPLVTIKSIGAIHWQAMFLWFKRVGFRRRPEPPAVPFTIVGTKEAMS